MFKETAAAKDKTSPTIAANPGANGNTQHTTDIENVASSSNGTAKIVDNSINVSSIYGVDIADDINAIDISFEADDMQPLDENELEQYAQHEESGESGSFGNIVETDKSRILIELSHVLSKIDSIVGIDNAETSAEQLLPTDENSAQAANIETALQVYPNQSSPSDLIFTPTPQLDAVFPSKSVSMNNTSMPPAAQQGAARNVANSAAGTILSYFTPSANLAKSMPSTSSQVINHSPQPSESDVAWSSDEDEFIQDNPCDRSVTTLPNLNASGDISELEVCGLCGYHSKRGWKILAKHYVRKHPDASIPTSRLPSKMNPVALVHNPIESTALFKTNEITIKSLCIFCDRSYDMNASHWLQHFIAHTGEYEYECNGCSHRLMIDLHKRCKSTNNLRLMEHELKDNKLFAYTCTKCNYTQLSKDNLLKHIDSEHQLLLSEDLAIEIILLNWIEPEQSIDFGEFGGNMNDDKNNQALMQAKLRNEFFGKDFVSETEPINLSSDEEDLSLNELNNISASALIDLTLTDDDE